MRPKIDIDLAKVEVLASRGLSMEQIADSLGISPATLYSRQREKEVFRDAIKRGRNKGITFAANKLWTLLEAGDKTALIFYLKTVGKFSEKVEATITGPNGGPVQIESRSIRELSTDELLELARMNERKSEVDSAGNPDRA